MGIMEMIEQRRRKVSENRAMLHERRLTRLSERAEVARADSLRLEQEKKLRADIQKKKNLRRDVRNQRLAPVKSAVGSIRKFVEKQAGQSKNAIQFGAGPVFSNSGASPFGSENVIKKGKANLKKKRTVVTEYE